MTFLFARGGSRARTWVGCLVLFFSLTMASGALGQAVTAAAGQVDLGVAQDDDVSVVGVNSNVTYSIMVTNQGATIAQSVLLQDVMAAGMTLVSASASQGSCSVQDGVVLCPLGNLAVGGRATIFIRLHAGVVGAKVNRVIVSADGVEATPGDNIADEETLVVFFSPARVNPQVMDLTETELDGGPAKPYPSIINVSGVTATVYQVVVSLQNINHSYPDDLDVLLVEPSGAGILLMSDTCGDGALVNVTLTFNDDASQALPDSVLDVPVASGVYRPTNFGSDDNFPLPAPPGPYGRTLSFFENINPNGAWSLYVLDDLPEDGGSIGGWSLRLITLDPMADLGVTASASPATLGVGSDLTYAIRVTNNGPAVATGVTVEDQIPTGAVFVSATASQGGCQAEGGLVTCALGNLAVGTVATVTLVVRPQVAGQAFNDVRVFSLEEDLNDANDEALTASLVQGLADVAVSVQASPEPALQGQPLTYLISITNRGPSAAQSIALSDPLPPGFTFISVASTQGSCSNASGTLQCQLGALAFRGNATVTLVGRPAPAGLLTNQAMVTIGPELDPVSSNNLASAISTISPAADLSVRLIGPTGSILIGGHVTYALAVSNAGPALATGVWLSNRWAASAAFVSANSADGSCEVMDGWVRCNLTDLAAAQEILVTIEIQALAVGSMQSTARVYGDQQDPTLGDRAVQLVTEVLPVIDLAVAFLDAPRTVILPNPLQYTIIVTNRGPSLATGIVLSNLLPATVQFLSASASQGSCSNFSGVVRCGLGALAPGSGAQVIVLARPLETGFLTNQAFVTGSETEGNGLDNTAAVTSDALVLLGGFANTAPIMTPPMGQADPYPSSILVSGVTVRVDRVSVTLSNLTHSYSDDLDFLLAGPRGQSVLLMSDAGGSQELPGVTLSFADGAASLLPDDAGIVSGVYRATDYGNTQDPFPAPAPQGPYGSALSVFNGLDPNGMWSLYAVDDADKDSGVLAGGWSVEFATRLPLADLALLASGRPAVAPASNQVYTVTVTNMGPSPAVGVVVSNVLPSGFSLVGLTTSQGGCNFDAEKIVCQLGRIPAGAAAILSFNGTFDGLGVASNRMFVAGEQLDPDLSNNSATLTTVIEPAVQITVQPAPRTVSAGQPVMLTAMVSGAPPLFFQWFRNGQAVAGETNDSFSRASATFVDEGIYTLRVSNRVSVAISQPAALTVMSAPLITAPPRTATNFVGSIARLEVTAIGSGQLRYQWSFEGQPIASGTNPVLLLPAVTQSQAGQYTVVVSNALGSATGGPVQLFVAPVDFGDAPRPGYPTLLAEGGAYHLIVPGFYLGQAIDPEPDGIPNASATGDDMTTMDDEDGVRFLDTLFLGGVARVEVVASAAGFVNAWVDFDGDQSWAGAAEQILTNAPVTAGTNQLNFRVLSSALARDTFARFRYNSTGGLGFGGSAADGEVEDYEVNLVAVVDLSVSQHEDHDPVALGSQLTYSVVVTNKGPSRATFVTLEDRLASGFSYVGATASQGSCAPQSGTVICSLGSISGGGAATVQITVLPTFVGTFSNRVSVSTPEVELDPSDNSNQDSTVVMTPPLITQHPQGKTVLQGASVQFLVVASGAPPLRYQWYRDSIILPNSTNDFLALSNVAPSQSGRYTVVVSNPAASVPSLAAQLTVIAGALPEVETLAAASISSTGAVLRARVDPNQLATQAWFEWGVTSGYGQLTPSMPIGAGNAPLETLTPLAGLLAGQQYHYRAVATNLAGVLRGGDVTFIWQADPKPRWTSVRGITGTTIRMTFSAKADQLYRVEASTNLTNWENAGAPTGFGNGTFQFDAPGTLPQRFFRIYSP